MLPFLALRVLRCPHVCVRKKYAFFAEIGRFLAALACCVRDSRPAFYHPLSFCLDANWIALRWFARASLCMNVTKTRDSLSARPSQNDGTSMCHSPVPLRFSATPSRTQKSPHCTVIQWGLVFPCSTRPYSSSSSSPSPSPFSVGIAPCSFIR